MLSLINLSFLSILLTGYGRPLPRPAVIPPGFTTCAEFITSPYVDNYKPGPNFSEPPLPNPNAFIFDDPTASQFINLISPGPDLGLQFPTSGLEITLPAATTLVLLDMGGFASAIKIHALNSTGASVTANSLIADNKIHNVILGGPDIKTIALSGGNNEGIIQRICIK